MTCPPSHVAVVGAGIIGSSIALNLAKKGCKVTLLDAAPHAASAASGESWAWLNANRKAPDHYRDINVRGMDAWRTLGALAEFPGTLVLEDARPANEAYPSEGVTPENLQHLEPALLQQAAAKGARLYRCGEGTGWDIYGIHLTSGGAADSDTILRRQSCVQMSAGFGYCAAATRAFVEEAAASGAEVRFSEAVMDVRMQPSSSRAGPSQIGELATASGVVQADAFVLAAGLGTAKLARMAGIEVPLEDKPATLNVYTVPAPPLLRHMLLSESLYLRQARDGSILISVYQDAETEKLRVPVDVASSPEESLRIGMQVREWAAAVVPGIANMDMDRVSLTRYPYPKDGHPIVGFTEKVPNLYIAVMHSGATLGPLIGQLVAAEISGTASEQELALLKQYRLERDFSTSQQAYTVGAAQKK